MLAGQSSGLRAERRREQLVHPAAHALGLDAVENDQQPNRQRHREGGVDVGGRNLPPVMLMDHVLADPRQDVDGQQVHRVDEQHPHEDRERERGHEAAVAVEDALDLSSTNSTTISTNAWPLPGTPAVALRTPSHR